MAAAVMARGANAMVDAAIVQVTVSWQSGCSVDACALLVAGHGTVRSDGDFVFYNQPEHISGSVRLVDATQRSATLTIDLTKVPTDVERVVVAGSVEGTFDGVSGLEVLVAGRRGEALLRFPIADPEPVAAMVFGEIYRRAGTWKFRAVAQGWRAGLAGLATDYGIDVDVPEASEPVTVPVAQPAPRPDWYPDSAAPSMLRWWDGTQWTTWTIARYADTLYACGRCGGPKQSRLAGAPYPACGRCVEEVRTIFAQWQAKAADALARTGPTGADWARLWEELRFRRIPEGQGRQVLRPLARGYLYRVVAFAFANGIIEPDEMAAFEDAVAQFGVSDPAIDEMRARMQRGMRLSTISRGDVPRITQTTLQLDADEILHLDISALHLRRLASGMRRNGGRLIATNRKLRFLGETGSNELNWSKIVEVRPEYRTVVVAATTSRGGGMYEVDDPDYVAAVISGTLKVAKRLQVVPGQRDSRAIPQTIKAEVWRRDGGACVECRATEYLEFDHIIPWSLGGATSVANLQLLCRRCNLAKGARV